MVTHTFDDIDTCMGDADASTWSWGYSGVSGNVTLSNSGTGAVSTFPTPLQVTHASSCGSTAPTLALQMNTEVKGSLTVNGYAVPPAGPYEDGEPYDSLGYNLAGQSALTDVMSKTITLNQTSTVVVITTLTVNTKFWVVRCWVEGCPAPQPTPSARPPLGLGRLRPAASACLRRPHATAGTRCAPCSPPGHQPVPLVQRRRRNRPARCEKHRGTL